MILTGQTTPDREDYCPTCPWVGDPKDPKSLENARKVRLALNLAVNKKAIISGLWKGTGGETPFSYYYYPFHKGYSTDWKIPPYDPERAKKLLAEAGHAGGFEVRVNPTVRSCAQDGPDVMEAVALDWEKIGIKVKRVPEATSAPSARRAGCARRTRRTGCTARRRSTSRWSRGSASSTPRAPSTSCCDGAVRRGDRRHHAGARRPSGARS